MVEIGFVEDVFSSHFQFTFMIYYFIVIVVGVVVVVTLNFLFL